MTFGETGQAARVIWTGTGRVFGEEPGLMGFGELQERTGHLVGQPVEPMERHSVFMDEDGNPGIAQPTENAHITTEDGKDSDAKWGVWGVLGVFFGPP